MTHHSFIHHLLLRHYSIKNVYYTHRRCGQGSQTLSGVSALPRDHQFAKKTAIKALFFIDSEFHTRKRKLPLWIPFRLILATLTACKAANLSFVMMNFSVDFWFVLRQSLDAQEITFLRFGQFALKLFLSIWKKNFQFQNSTKLRTFHSKPYDILMLGALH